MVSELAFKGDPYKSFHQNKAEKTKAFERFFEIKKILKKNKDIEGLALLEKLLDACIDYVIRVVDFKFNLTNIKLRSKSIEDYRARAEMIDSRKRKSHNALIASLESFNRYLGKKYGWQVEEGIIPPGGVCTLPSHHIKIREKIGDWAWFLVAGLYGK